MHEQMKVLLDKEMPRLENIYSWGTNSAHLFNFKTKEKADFRINIALKKHVAEQWAQADESRKIELANNIILGWGKLKNKKETVEIYVELADQDTPSTPLQGVSSYSKLLAFVRPDLYAIYDSRVAVALNAIQLVKGVENPVFFHYPVGRQAEIVRFSAIFNKDFFKQLVPQWTVPTEKQAYEVYMRLLHEMANSQQTIHHYEMLLFGLSIELADMALKRLDSVLIGQWQSNKPA